MSHRIFPSEWATCPHTKKIKLKLLVVFLDEILSLKNKSCVIEKMPVPVLRFAYLHSDNNYVKIVSASTHQTKLKKILIKQKHVIGIIFYVNEETHARPSFKNYIYAKKTCFKSSYLHLLQYFPATLKLLIMCMKPDFLNTILKEPDDFSKYVKFLINY